MDEQTPSKEGGASNVPSGYEEVVVHDHPILIPKKATKEQRESIIQAELEKGAPDKEALRSTGEKVQEGLEVGMPAIAGTTAAVASGGNPLAAGTASGAGTFAAESMRPLTTGGAAPSLVDRLKDSVWSGMWSGVVQGGANVVSGLATKTAKGALMPKKISPETMRSEQLLRGAGAPGLPLGSLYEPSDKALAPVLQNVAEASFTSRIANKVAAKNFDVAQEYARNVKAELAKRSPEETGRLLKYTLDDNFEWATTKMYDVVGAKIRLEVPEPIVPVNNLVLDLAPMEKAAKGSLIMKTGDKTEVYAPKKGTLVLNEGDPVYQSLAKTQAGVPLNERAKKLGYAAIQPTEGDPIILDPSKFTKTVARETAEMGAPKQLREALQNEFRTKDVSRIFDTTINSRGEHYTTIDKAWKVKTVLSQIGNKAKGTDSLIDDQTRALARKYAAEIDEKIRLSLYHNNPEMLDLYTKANESATKSFASFRQDVMKDMLAALDKEPGKIGDILLQPDGIHRLQILKDNLPRGFYQSEVEPQLALDIISKGYDPVTKEFSSSAIRSRMKTLTDPVLNEALSPKTRQGIEDLAHLLDKVGEKAGKGTGTVFIQLKQAAAGGAVVGGVAGLVSGDTKKGAEGFALGATGVLLAPWAFGHLVANPSIMAKFKEGIIATKTAAEKGRTTVVEGRTYVSREEPSGVSVTGSKSSSRTPWISPKLTEVIASLNTAGKLAMQTAASLGAGSTQQTGRGLLLGFGKGDYESYRQKTGGLPEPTLGPSLRGG